MLRRGKRGTLKPNSSSIVLDLKTVLTTRGITQPSAFLLKIGINTNSANKMLKGQSVQVNMKQLTALCLNLNCTPNDLFAVRDIELPEHHALNGLALYKAKADEQSVAEWLAGKSVEEVRELMKK
ncbi:helix-turn-helix domain-containing protein [Flavobacterium sp. PLA-1-15]|uniref:helix-turn-helix domain-containing protein n=1 Tax=Flavobacterium sp. PLA-1-15 TaxID=3380533 RepID=UPI003B7E55A8